MLTWLGGQILDWFKVCFQSVPLCNFPFYTIVFVFKQNLIQFVRKDKATYFFFLKSIGQSFAEKLISNRSGSISAHFDGFTIFKSKRVLISKEFGLGINYFGVRKITH